MRVCIVGGGGGANNAANVIRRLDKEAQIDLFDKRSEIGHEPCEIPYVLSGFLPSWQDSFVFRPKFYNERNINVHLNTEVTDIITEEKRLIAGGESYSYDKAILDLSSTPTIPPVQGLDGRNEFVLDTSLSTARTLEKAIPRHSSAAIVGVGQIALDIAEVLQARNYDRIYLVGRADRVLRAYLDKDMAEIVKARIEQRGIELILSAQINSIKSRKSKKVIPARTRARGGLSLIRYWFQAQCRTGQESGHQGKRIRGHRRERIPPKQRPKYLCYRGLHGELG